MSPDMVPGGARRGVSEGRVPGLAWTALTRTSQHTPRITRRAGEGCSAPLRSPGKPRAGTAAVGGPQVPPAGQSPDVLPTAADHRRSMPVGFAAESAE